MATDEAPTYHKARDGSTVCDGCGCELGSHYPGAPGKYAGHTDHCPFMQGKEPTNP